MSSSVGGRIACANKRNAFEYHFLAFFCVPIAIVLGNLAQELDDSRSVVLVGFRQIDFVTEHNQVATPLGFALVAVAAGHAVHLGPDGFQDHEGLGCAGKVDENHFLAGQLF